MKARRALNADDLYALTQAQREADQPRAVCAALETLSAQVIGHRLFTFMRASRAFSICASRSAPTDCASATIGCGYIGRAMQGPRPRYLAMRSQTAAELGHSVVKKSFAARMDEATRGSTGNPSSA